MSKEEDPHNKNIPKLVINQNNDLIYISRAVIPNSKNDSLENINYKKQCVFIVIPEEILISFPLLIKKFY